MKNILTALFTLVLIGCTTENSGESRKQKREKEVPLTELKKVRTKGIPHGFLHRDYVVTKDGSTAFTTFQLPKMMHSFIVKIDLKSNIPVLAGFSGSHRDMEPMLALNDSILLFASDRPLYEGDTTDDFNLWYSYFSSDKLSDPIAFDTVINTVEDEFYPSMTDKLDLYFTAVYGDRKYDDLYRSSYTDSGYKKPEMLSFCEEQDLHEFNSYVAPDGKLIIFTSYGRDGEMGGGDLFYSIKSAQGKWQDPRPLGDHINSQELEFSPFLKGDTLFFTSNRIDTSWKNQEFKYLSTIQLKADSLSTGMQNVYMVPWEKGESSAGNTKE